MGLDSLELLMNIEQQFGIRIPDAEAEKINTVQELVDCVDTHVQTKPTEKCVSMLVFHKLRAAMHQLWPAATLEISPATVLSDVFTGPAAHAHWLKLQSVIGCKLPALERVPLGAKTRWKAFFEGFAKQPIPLHEKTMRDLVAWILALNHKVLFSSSALASKKDVERIVYGTIAETLAIPVDEIQPEHSIVRDYGLD